MHTVWPLPITSNLPQTNAPLPGALRPPRAQGPSPPCHCMRPNACKQLCSLHEIKRKPLRPPIRTRPLQELILFSRADLDRSIPSMVDGLKPGQRKILYASFKRNLKKDIKARQGRGGTRAGLLREPRQGLGVGSAGAVQRRKVVGGQGGRASRGLGAG